MWRGFCETSREISCKAEAEVYSWAANKSKHCDNVISIPFINMFACFTMLEADWKKEGVWNISVSSRSWSSTVGEGASCGLHELGGKWHWWRRGDFILASTTLEVIKSWRLVSQARRSHHKGKKPSSPKANEEASSWFLVSPITTHSFSYTFMGS